MKFEISKRPAGPREHVQLSLLNDFLFCPRRAALKLVDGHREANEHTARGDIAHEHADLPGYESQISDSKSQIILLRALPVWSDRLGLSGKCDIVEVELRSASNLKSQISNLKSTQADLPVKSEISNLKSTPAALRAIRPIEFKHGRRRQWENDDAQLCAQALCLEEQFHIPITHGAVFHAQSKRRREVVFTPELRSLTERAIAELHALHDEFEVSNSKCEIPRLPAAAFKPACEHCSLYETCLPRITDGSARATRAARDLFQI